MSRIILPDTFFQSNGKLQPSVQVLFEVGLGYDAKILSDTVWKTLSPNKEYPFSAITLYKNVFCAKYVNVFSVRDWLELIAHEEWHRQEVGSNLFSGLKWYVDYGVEYLIRSGFSYHNMEHEKRAYSKGCGNNSECSQLICFENEAIIDIYSTHNLSDNSRKEKIKNIALRYRNK